MMIMMMNRTKSAKAVVGGVLRNCIRRFNNNNKGGIFCTTSRCFSERAFTILNKPNDKKLEDGIDVALMFFNQSNVKLLGAATTVKALLNKKDLMMDLKIFKRLLFSKPDDLIIGLCNIGHWPKAYFMLKRMLLDHMISPEVETFDLLIKTICNEGTQQLHVAARVIDMMHQTGVSPNIATYNSLIDAHCVKGEIDQARTLVRSMSLPAPDNATYTTLLNGYCNAYDNSCSDPTNDIDNVMDDAMMLLYHEMIEKGFKPGCVTYHRIIHRCFKSGLIEDAYKLLVDLLAQGQTLDRATYVDILQALFSTQGVQDALSLFHFLDEHDSNLNSDPLVLQTLLYGVARCAEVDISTQLLEGIIARGVKPTPFTYNLVFCSLCDQGRINDAKLYLQMNENHCWPDTLTYNCLLRRYLKSKCYDDVKVLLFKMKTQQHCLDHYNFPVLRASVAAGSLDATLSDLINELAPPEEMDFP